MPKLTAESFLSVLRQSGLVDKDQLKRLVDEMQQAGINTQDSDAIVAFLIQREVVTQWQADKLQQGKHKGFTLGKYRLLRLLGKGGMSSVYLAEHVLMRRRCAIKVLPIKRVKDSSYLARFHREAQAVASLDHPNIVRAYDIDHEIDKDTEIHFLVMEYVNGRSLQEVIKEDGMLSVEDTAEYMRQAALGLAHAHTAGLVHRDVKPGNLLVDTNGVVKLLDLGLARFATTDEENPLTVTHDEKVLGTADYLSPEQALDSHLVDLRADIYSLGCTVYYCLTAHPPFVDGTLAQRLMWHQTKDPPLITTERPDVPASFNQIVLRMMAKKPDDRFQTMNDVANAMSNWLELNASDAWRAAHPAMAQSGTGSGSNLKRAASAVAAAQAEATPTPETAQGRAIPIAPPTVGDPPTELDHSGASGFFQQMQPAAQPTAVSIAPQPQMAVPAVATAQPQMAQPVAMPPQAAPWAVAQVAPSVAASMPAQQWVQAQPTPMAAAPAAAPVAPQTAQPVYAAPVGYARQPMPQAAAPRVASPVAPPQTMAAQPAAPAVQRMPWEQDDGLSAGSQVDPGSSNVFDFASRSHTEGSAGVLAETLSFATASSAATFQPPQFQPAPIATAAPVAAAPIMAPAAPVAVAQNIGQPPAWPAIPAQMIAAPVAASPVAPAPIAQPPLAYAAAPVSQPPQAPAPMMATAVPMPAAPAPTMTYAAPPVAAHSVVVPPAPSFEQPAAFPWGEATNDGDDASEGEYQSFEQPAAVAPNWNQPPAVVPAAAANPVAGPAYAQPVPGQPLPSQPMPGYPAGYPQGVPAAAPVGYATEAPALGAAPVATATNKKPIPMKVILGAGGGLAAVVIGVVLFFAFSGDTNAKPKNIATTTTKTGSNPKPGGKPPKKENPAIANAPDKEKEKIKPAPEPLKPINGKVIEVGPDGSFKEIWEALSYLRKNRNKFVSSSRGLKANVTVKVAGGQTYEPIILDNSDAEYPSGIHVIAQGAKAKLKQRDDGLAIRVIKAEGLRIENFEVDANGKDKAIEFVLGCPFATISKLSISGYTKAGIYGSGLTGAKNSHVLVEDCEFRPGNDASSGILIEKGLSESIRFIMVERCRMIGPMKSGIEINGPVVAIELRENIFHQTESAIRLAKTNEAQQLLIANNTFHATKAAAIHFDVMPKGRSAGWVFHRNIFAKSSGPDLKVDSGFDQTAFDSFLIKQGGTGIENNFSDRADAAKPDAGERELVIESGNKGKPIAFINSDPKSPDFLGIAKNAPYANAPNPAFGTKPYAGAKTPK